MTTLADSPEMTRINAVVTALAEVRLDRAGMVEAEIVDRVAQALLHAGISPGREVPLPTRPRWADPAPSMRVDLFWAGVAIEVKRGRPRASGAAAQLRRYARCPDVHALVLVAERAPALPERIGGKPAAVVSLLRNWGVAV